MAHRSNVEQSDPQLQNLAFMRFDLTPRADASLAKLLLLLLSNNNKKNHQHKQITSPDFLKSELDFNQSNQTSESEFQALPQYHIVIFH